jgi:CRP/FNR family transcriptional regulator, cyclic AMP receptor protein
MTKTLPRAAEIASLQAFAWVPKDRMRILCSNMEELHVGKGEILYRPGEMAKHLFCVFEGMVGLCLSGSGGRFLRLILTMPGDWFGVSALVPGWRRVSRAMAVHNARVGRIEAKVFVTDVCGMPWGIFSGLTESTIKPLLMISLRRAQFLVEPLFDRIVLTLWEYVSRPAAKGAKGLLTSVLTHEEFAALVGASRPRVSLALKEIEGKGFITREGKQIRVHEKPLHDYLQRKFEFLL